MNWYFTISQYLSAVEQSMKYLNARKRVRLLTYQKQDTDQDTPSNGTPYSLKASKEIFFFGLFILLWM